MRARLFAALAGALILPWALTACVDSRPPAPTLVGFFTPRGVAPELIGRTGFGMFNAETPQQVHDSLSRARAQSYRVDVDFSATLTSPLQREGYAMAYRDRSGKQSHKLFEPVRSPTLTGFPPDAELARRLGLFLPAMTQNAAAVRTVFLADEPYLHGISRAEMERAARLVRGLLDANGLAHARLGVIFASGMFDPDFARQIDAEAGHYVATLDGHLRAEQARIAALPAAQAAEGAAQLKQWLDVITTPARLSTYDRAGNMFLEGGIPHGYDVVGFDFYVSTLLFDSVHERSLAWLAQRGEWPQCAQFADLPMNQLRTRLSFFQDGQPLRTPHMRSADRALLDAAYRCRMGALTALLQRQTKTLPRPVQLMLVSESSSNGLLEFTRGMARKPVQSAAELQGRVLDEVQRGLLFYRQHQPLFGAGLVFFTYEDEYDASIRLNIGGASRMQQVLQRVFTFAAGA